MNVGELVIGLRADVARIQSDMDATKRAVTGAMKDVEGAVSAARNVLVSLTGVASVGAFVHLINGAIEAKGRLYDLSLQTGISVESLGSLAKVALYSDTQLADVAGASNKLSKALHSQNEDSKGAAAGIRALGLDFNRFRDLAPEQQLLAVAHAMDGFEDGTGKAAVAMALWGKAGAAMLPFMKELAERGLMATRETTAGALAAKQFADNLVELKGAGEGFIHLLAADMVPWLVKYTNQLIDARAAQKGWLDVLKVGVPGEVPDMGAALARNAESIEKAREAVAKIQADGRNPKARWFGRSWLETLEEANAELQRQMGLRKQLLDQQQRDALALGAGVGQDPRLRTGAGAKKKLDPDLGGGPAGPADPYIALVAGLREKLEAERQELQLGQSLTAAQKDALAVMVRVRDGKIKLTEARAREVSGLLEERLAAERANKEREAEAKWLEEANKETAAYIERQTQLTDSYAQQARMAQDQLRTYGMTAEQLQALDVATLRHSATLIRAKQTVDDFNPAQRDLNALYEQQAQALDATADALAALSERMSTDQNSPLAGADRAVRDYLEHVKRAGDATYNAVGGAIQGLEDGMTAALTRGRFDVRRFVDAVLAEVIRLQVVRPMMATIFGGPGGNGGGLGNWLSLGASLLAGMNGAPTPGGFNANGTPFNNPSAWVPPGRADGGPVDAGGTYLVGERGPEILHMGPGSGGTVIPNAGTTVNSTLVLHVDARADAAAIAEQTSAQLAANNRRLMELLHARGVM